MFERYTRRARRAIFFAREEALHRGADEIGTRDLFLGLTYDPHTGECPFRYLYQRRDEWRATLGAGPWPTHRAKPGNLPLSQQGKISLARCAEEATLDDRRGIDAEHLLRAILRGEDETAAALAQAGLTLEQARADSKLCQQTNPDLRPVDLLVTLLRTRRWAVTVALGLLILFAFAVVYLHLQN